MAVDDCFNKGISKAGTLIMSFKLTIGKVAILDIDAFHNEAIISIFPKYDENNIFRDFLFWALPIVTSDTNVHGVIMGNTLNKKSLSNMIVPIPPLKEQKRITDKLNKIFGTIDIIDELQSAYSSDLEILKAKVIDAGIQGKLTEQLPEDGNAEDLYAAIQEDIDEDEKILAIPDNWQWIKLGWAMNIERGGSPRPIKAFMTDAEGGINWIKIGDVSKEGKYITQTKERIKPEGEKKSRKVVPGDFLLTNSMSFGRPYISKIYGCIHDGWLLLRNSKGVFDLDYLYYLLSSKYAYDQFCKKASGATVDNLNKEKVASAVIPLPPISEQTRIAEVIEKTLSMIY